MRVTTRARYAIRALYDLAFHRRGQAAQAKEIAAREQIPLRFLTQILQDLRKAGLVDTTWQDSLEGPPRRYYSLTGEGRDALASFTRTWQPFRDAVDSALLQGSP